jgi:predicted ATPase
LIFEDLHWLDAETQAYLLALTESIATARVLLLVNYRPEYQHPWGNKTYYMQLRLDPLGRAEAEAMLSALLAEKGGTAGRLPLHQFILEKTEGNPFFMEEIVQTLHERGLLTTGAHDHAPLPTELQLPPTVQGVLAARLDRLPPEEKALLQTLAVIGKEFSFGLLKAVADQPEDVLYWLLSHLRDAEFIYEQPAFPEPDYVFKHALTQEVAYNSLLVERRRVLHEQTAQAIEAVYHDRVEERYSELAYHYSRSGNTEKAIEYLQKAGQQAVQRPAYVEAINHLTAALALLANLPDTPERARRELIVQVTLGVPLAVTKGFSSPEANVAYLRARELCQQLGETPQLTAVLMGLWVSALVRAELKVANELATQLFNLAQQQQDTALLLQAHLALGMTLYYQGEFVSAQEHFAQETVLYDRQQHRFQGLAYGLDLGTSCKRWAAWSLWMLGYPEQALMKSQDSVSLAHELRHPFSFAFSLFWAAMLYSFRREPRAAEEQANAAILIATEHGFVQVLPLAVVVQEWSRVARGNKGIIQIKQGLSSYRDTAAGLAQPQYLSLFAEAYGWIGQIEEGLTILAEALAIAQETDQGFYNAELYRLKGELTLQSSVQRLGSSVTNPQSSIPNPQTEAEGYFLKAIDIAREQRAKSLELRAVMSLARLWQQQGKLHEACDTLSEIYSWFTEGFDTKDLQEAKALLDELSH